MLKKVQLSHVKACERCNSLHTTSDESSPQVLVDCSAIVGEVIEDYTSCVVCDSTEFTNELPDSSVARPYDKYAKAWGQHCYTYESMELMLSRLYELDLIDEWEC